MSTTRGRKQTKIYNYDRIPGCLGIQKAHRILADVAMFHGEQAGIKTDEGSPWVAKCPHGTMIAMHTLPLLKWAASKPDSWCKECQAKFVALQDVRTLRSGLLDKQEGRATPMAPGAPYARPLVTDLYHIPKLQSIKQ